MALSTKLKLTATTLIFIASLFTIPLQEPVFALSEFDLRAQGVYFYDPGETEVCYNDPTIGVGENNTHTAMDFFRKKGMSSEQAAGLVGNLLHESGLMPNRKQSLSGEAGVLTISSIAPVEADIANTDSSRGYGIAQWTTEGRQQAWLDFAATENQDPLSLDLQLKFVWHELETQPLWGLEHFLASPDVRQATWIGLAFFERPIPTYDPPLGEGTAGRVRQPDSSEPKSLSALNVREGLANEALSAFGNAPLSVSASACGGGIANDLSEPSYAAIPGFIVNDSPSTVFKESDCAPEPPGDTPGLKALTAYITERWNLVGQPQTGYFCRPILWDFSNPVSIHGLGRAIDIFRNANDPTQLASGNEIRNFLINNAQRLGIQRIIWNRFTWVADRDGWNPYGGSNPHTDHLHIEINLEASTNENLI